MLTQQDLDLLKKKGISEEKLHSQLESFKTGFPFLKLAGAASPKHGITIPTEREKKSYLIRHQRKALLCLNDTEDIGDFEAAKQRLIEAFDEILPERSSFELPS